MNISLERLHLLKKEFRYWYGMLSTNEIMRNHSLIKIISQIEEQYFLKRIP